jgi:hypothetical protein
MRHADHNTRPLWNRWVNDRIDRSYNVLRVNFELIDCADSKHMLRIAGPVFHVRFVQGLRPKDAIRHP